MRELGLLVMSYGTARGPDDVEAYYTHVRHGRPPSPELLEELKSRYEAIGGRSPLIEITEAQASGIEKELNSGGAAETLYRSFVGMKHQRPYIEDAIAEMASWGIRSGVGLVMAPHYSRFSVGEYADRASAAAEEHGLKLGLLEDFHLAPAFLELVADRVRAARGRLPGELRDDALIIFSAHSLPSRIVEAADPYPEQLEETAEAVARVLGSPPFRTAWQSAGRTGEQWLGPDLCDVIRELPPGTAVVSCPVGFVADHLEVLYDIDIGAREAAKEAGVVLSRTESPNADPAFVRALAGVVRDFVSREGI